MRASVLFAILMTLAACAPTLVDYAQAPPSAIGLGDDDDAILYSQWAFASPARTRGRPADAAKAVAAVDYLAGALNMSPRWIEAPPFAKMYMLQARADVRHVLGISPTAPSQVVVNTMQQAAIGLTSGNQPEVVAALSPPVYTLPPQETVTILANMPFVRSANLATQYAGSSLTAPGNSEMFRR